MNFADRFKGARLAAGMSQKDAADGLVASSYISLIESGSRVPKQELIEAFAERFGVTPESLLTDIPNVSQELALSSIRAQINDGQFNSSIDALEEILSTTAIESVVSLQAQLLKAKCLKALGESAEALQILEQLVGLDRPEHSALHAEAVLELLRFYLHSGDSSFGALLGEQFIGSQAKPLWPAEFLVGILCQTATCHVALGNLSRARSLAAQAGEIAKRISDPRSLAFYEWERSGIAESLGNTSEAIILMKRSLAHAQAAELLDSLPRMKSALAVLSVNAALEDISGVRNLCESAYLECLATGNVQSAAYACLALAELSLRDGITQEALKHAETGINLISATHIEPFLELAIVRIKSIFVLDQDLDQVVRSAEELEAIDRHSTQDLSGLWVFIAREFAQRGQLDRSTQAYEEAISVANSLDAPTVSIDGK